MTMDGDEMKPGSWECSTCTWVNENQHGLSCIMCQTERRIASSSQTSTSTNASGGGAASPPPESAVERGAPAGESHQSPPTAKSGDDSMFNSRQCDDTSLTEPPTKPSRLTKIEEIRNETDPRGKWDPFAALENNYQSSSEDDDESDEDDDRSNDGSGEVEDRKMGNDNGGNQWDAFKSLEQNYESSDAEFDSSSSCSDGDGEECEFSDGDIEEDVGENPHDIIECVDLVDSDEDASVCEVVEQTNAKMPGKENNKADKRSSRRRKPDLYTINSDSDSDELSEVESRPLPSPASRPLPPWQRRRSTPIQKDEKLKASDSFSCMNGRNDIMGGSGAGVNGFRLSKRKGDDSNNDATGKRKSRKAASTSSTAGGTRKRKATSAAASAKSKATTRKKRKRNTSKAASTTSAAAPKRRRKRTYKRRSNKRSARGSTRSNANTGRANNNAWSARERGVRQPYNRRGGGGGGDSTPYMIGKVEPMLRNVGGASIQF